MAIRSGGDAARQGQNRGKHFSLAASNSSYTDPDQRNCQQSWKAEKDVFLTLEAVPFEAPALYNGTHWPLSREQSAMKAQMARFVISVVAMLVGLITFLGLDAGWIPAAIIVLLGFVASEAAFRRLADQETIQRDLEERVRNQHL
jgi:hypothetical protein